MCELPNWDNDYDSEYCARSITRVRRKARRDYKCESTGVAIPKGSYYHEVTFVTRHYGWEVQRQQADIGWAHELFARAHGVQFCPDYFGQAVDDCRWSEPDTPWGQVFDPDFLETACQSQHNV
ncbi:MAG: hypothetical protein AAFV46_00105 [Cyanobacteria bacterium J06635_11]